MEAASIDWPWDQMDQRQRCTQGTDDVLDLCEELIKRFRTQRAPMPIVVLRAQSPDEQDRVTEIVEVLYHVYSKGSLLCKLLPEGYQETDERGENAGSAGEAIAGKAGRPPTPLQHYGHALEMIRCLADSSRWSNFRGSQYKPYALPRSRMLEAIEDAVDITRLFKGEVSPAQARPDASEAMRRLRKLNWRPERPDEPRTLDIRAFLTAFLSPGTLIGGALASAFIAKLINQISTVLLIVFLVAIILIGLIRFIRQNGAPLSWLGQASQWFTTTTFVGPVGDVPAAGFPSRWLRWWPRRSWQVRTARVRFVIEQLIAARSGPPVHDGADSGMSRERRFYLQLRVLALLEDLRSNHRRWAPDLRHRKRTWPPMVFLPQADRTPGGLVLLQAVSDVRSRRSEQDPLLILTDSQELERLPRSGPDLHRGVQERAGQAHIYEAWLTAMRVDQSPSRGSHWPWVLHYTLNSGKLTDRTSRRPQPAARRSAWNLWSLWSLAAVVLLLACAGVWRNLELARTYCGGGLFGSDAELVWATGSPRQCVGVDINGVQEFVARDGGVSLSGTIAGQTTTSAALAAGAGVPVSAVSLGALESGIARQNQVAAQTPEYVTFVYAGPLTTGSDETQALGAIKELAGVYAWQYYVDTTSGDTLKLRIDIANGGLDLADQELMTQKIIAAANRDRSIVGVIGLGRDTSTSQQAVRELAAADLAVVDTTNSSDTLSLDWNYYGLAATNSEEAKALRPYVGTAVNRTAVILERDVTPSDPYSTEQAGAAGAMLKLAGFTLIGGGPLTFPVSENRNDLENSAAASEICQYAIHPSVIYLAGRSDDLSGLLEFLKDKDAECFASHVIVLSGDDLTKSEFTNFTSVPFPPHVTVFYTALTDTAKTGPNSGLTQALKSALDLSNLLDYADPVFTDGQLALAFDGAHALYNAAVSSQALAYGRSGIPPALRCSPSIVNGATGSIGFTGIRHGIDILRVVPNADDEPQVSQVFYSATTSGTCTPVVNG